MISLKALRIKTFYVTLSTILLSISFLTNAHAKVILVGKGKTFTKIKNALNASEHGDTILIDKGHYKEGNLVIDKAIYLLGKDFPVIDGEFKYEVISVKSDGVTIKGLHVKNSGKTVMSDPCGIKLYSVKNVLVEGNILTDNYFGIYLQDSKKSIVKNNTVHANEVKDPQSGNGIHCFKSDSIQVIGNNIKGHRDGIYFEFVTHSIAWRNVAKNNLRYGLHFMFSHNNAYITNYFKHNGAGVAVMFTRKVVMMNNTFEENWGDSAYGVLFKELSDCYLSGNKFLRNTTGIFFDGTNRVIAENNIFQENGWGMRMQANCMDNVIAKNNFLGNTFDVTTNGTLTLNKFADNYWDNYEGYDLNKDKIGDIPYHPLSLYAVIVERNPPAMLLYRSFMINLLDKSEKVIPSLTPENFVDNSPRMSAYNL